LDADTEGFSEHFATGLLGPLVCGPPADPRRELPGDGCAEISFVKAFYRRPFRHNGISLPEGGGRVNRLMARPALRQFFPALASVRQPLAGEVAARRSLLERIPFVTGYGVEIAMLIDVWRQLGLDGMAQVDLEEHSNRHQPLVDLEAMAQTVLATIAARVAAEGRLALEDPQMGAVPVERPPLADALAR
jgi:glucosyl-3-phosphoglycerate synthase